MLFRFLGSILNSIVAFAYPTYASFKSLSRRPASEQDLERWLMYWSVVGSIVAVEYVAEWSISWIPFYRFLKTIFFVWLALPQTQGATYMYQTHLAPFLTVYEPTIDSYVSQYKIRLYAFVQGQFRILWKHISALIAQHTGVNLNNVDPSASPSTGAAQGTHAPFAADHLNQGAQWALGFWRAYGPSIINALQPPRPAQEEQQQVPEQQRPTRATAVPVQASSAPTGSSATDLDTIRARRREIEAELARLTALETEQQGSSSSNSVKPIPMAQSMYLPDVEADSESEASLGTDARTVRDSGRYEEIQRDEIDDDEGEGSSAPSAPPAPARPWSFWSRSNSGYSPLKDKDD